MEKTPFNRHSGYTQLDDSYTVFNHFVELPPLQKIVLKNILVTYCLLWNVTYETHLILCWVPPGCVSDPTLEL